MRMVGVEGVILEGELSYTSLLLQYIKKEGAWKHLGRNHVNVWGNLLFDAGMSPKNDH